jgi:eukaryotic-like serine/threonine-protein kinase
LALIPGTRLGPYEVIAQIGVGGMGEVYKATDTNLKRAVAIKVLPASVAADRERLARFQREAEVLAALNHPNIAQIHGLEKSDGITALVMELAEGPTLADRIAHGAISFDDALPIAKQIAEALEAAHEQGIVHRDLKPANIKVQDDGTVKVLDFGLAKALEPVSSATTVSMSPTITTPAMTRTGMILGTAAYMSPEQAKGHAADKRCDVWAFGCVLYEMLTAQRAFQGENVADTLAAVLRGQPVWSALPPNLPPPLNVVLRRCLEKDRRKRIGSVASALAIVDDPGSLTNAGSMGSIGGTPVASWRRPVVAAAALVLVGAVSGVTAWMATRPSAGRVSRLAIAPDIAHALAVTGTGRDVAISRDGNRVAYVGGNGTLLVRSIDQLEPTILVRQDDPTAPFFSPDGQWIGYFPSNRSLRKVQVAGGPTVALTTFTAGAVTGGATWADDGTVVFATTDRSSGLQIVSQGTTVPKTLTTPDRQRGEVDHLWPEFLPGGRAVLFTITATTVESAQIAVFDLDTGGHRVVIPGGSHAHYVPTGHLVYGAAGALRAVPFDLDRLQTTGASVQIVSPVLTTASGAADFDISTNGTLVYVPGAVAPGLERELVWVGRDGKTESLGAPPRAYLYPRLSPDGTRILLDIRDQDSDIWLWDLRRKTLTNVTRNPALDRFPLWTPDGKQFVFVSNRDRGMSVIYRQSADGTGDAERLSDDSAEQQTPNSMSTDGKQLVIDRDNDLMLLSLDGSRRVSTLVQTMFSEIRASLSPDGRWLAYHANESGQFEIYVKPFPSVNEGRAQISTQGGVQPWWSRKGDQLFYVTQTGALMSVQVGGGKSWSASAPTALSASVVTSNPSSTAAATFDVSVEGRFLMSRPLASPDEASSPPGIVVVQNWFEELKRLVPK